jgi:hypothetical protein
MTLGNRLQAMLPGLPVTEQQEGDPLAMEYLRNELF